MERSRERRGAEEKDDRKQTGRDEEEGRVSVTV